MLCKKALVVIAVMASVLSFGQGETAEFGLITDNDLYA
jgi:hypothetical protein